MPDIADPNAALARLRWRARRGTRELDRLIGGWLEARHARVDNELRQAFDALLDEADPDLWDWLTGHQPAPQRLAAIVDEIRAFHRV